MPLVKDRLFVFSLLFVFIVAVGAIVMMVRPLLNPGGLSLPALPSSGPSSLSGMAYAVGDTVEPGYAPPWDVFSPSSGLFFTVTQPDYTGLTGADTVDVMINVDRPGAWIHHQFYLSGQDGWSAPMSFGGAWHQNTVSKTLTFTLDELYAENYVLVFTCKPNALAPGGWDCGCTSTTDPSCRYFAIQEFDGPPGAPPADSCAPDETRTCYTGPAGTRNIGACSDGVDHCSTAGTWSGTCTGQVLPAAEDCTGTVDKDCDGALPSMDTDCAGSGVCTNDCAPGSIGCTGDTPWTCGEADDGDDCLDKVAGAVCATGETCQSGVCVVPRDCASAFDGPRDGACAAVTSSSFTVSWTPSSTSSSNASSDRQLLRVSAVLHDVKTGCGAGSDCVVKEDGLPMSTQSYPVTGLAPGTTYYARAVALCTENGTRAWKDAVWNCTTAEQETGGAPTGLNITACNRLFEDTYVNPNRGNTVGMPGVLGIPEPVDQGIGHTFIGWAYTPPSRSLSLVEDGGLTSIKLDASGMGVADEKSVFRLMSVDIGSLQKLVTEDGIKLQASASDLCQDYAGYVMSTAPIYGGVTTTYALYPDGTAILPGGSSTLRIGIFAGAGSALDIASFFNPDFLNHNLRMGPGGSLARCGPPRDSGSFQGTWTTFEKTGLGAAPYGAYLAFLAGADGKRYGILCRYPDVSKADDGDPRCGGYGKGYDDVYVVDVTDLGTPVMEGKLTGFSGLFSYLTPGVPQGAATIGKYAYPIRYRLLWSPIAPESGISAPVTGWYRARITEQDGKMTIFDVSDPLDVQAVEKLDVPEQACFTARGGTSAPYWTVFVGDTVYFRPCGGKVYRHAIGAQGWQALDFGDAPIDSSAFALASDGKVMMKYADDRSFSLYGITGDSPVLLSQGVLPYGYRDASLYHAQSNAWSMFGDPLLVAQGDGTYRLYLRSDTLNHYKVGVSAFKLAPGPTKASCVCQPACAGKACGVADGCGGYCETNNGCASGQSCQGRKGAPPACGAG